MTTSHGKKSRAVRPKSMMLKTGLPKSSKKALAAIDKAVNAGYYRRDLAALAKAKYIKMRNSFYKKTLW